VALLRFWHDKYGAQIISATDDVIECTVSRPPSTREQAMELAREQFLYCADIVYQGVQTVSNLGAGLLNSKYWYFWWD
jgi:hypothetical protein